MKAKFEIGEKVVAPFRYPDEDGYFGMSEVVAVFCVNDKFSYELKNCIQVGKSTWIGYATDATIFDTCFGENYAPAQEHELYRVGDSYDYSIGNDRFTLIRAEHCYDLDS